MSVIPTETTGRAGPAEPARPAEPTDAPGPHRRWVDPLLALLCALGAVAAYLPRGFEGLLTRDLGIYAYGGQQLLDGDLPYEAVVNRAGPLAQALPGLGAWLGRLLGADSGADDVVAMRALYLGFTAVSIGLAYLVATRVFRSRHAGLVAAAALLSFGGLVELATYGPREKTPMVMFVLAAMLAAAHRRWPAAGFLVALATLTWQPAFVPAIVVLTLAALLDPGADGRLVALIRVALGGLLATGMVAGTYLLHGAFDVLLEGFWGINAGYAGTYGALDDLPAAWSRLSIGFGWSVHLLVAGLLAVVVLAVGAALVRGSGPEGSAGPGWDRALLAGIAAGAVAATAWTAASYNSWPDAFPLMPFAALGAGGVGAVLAALLRRASAGFPGAVLTGAGTAALVAGAVALAVTFGLSTRADEMALQADTVDAVLAELPSEPRLVSVSAPTALVLSRSEQEPRAVMFSPPIERWLDDTWPGGLAGYAEEMLATRPHAVVTERSVPEWLEPSLREQYVRVGRVTNMTWWLDRDLRDRAPALRELLAEAGTSPDR